MYADCFIIILLHFHISIFYALLTFHNNTSTYRIIFIMSVLREVMILLYMKKKKNDISIRVESSTIYVSFSFWYNDDETCVRSDGVSFAGTCPCRGI